MDSREVNFWYKVVDFMPKKLVYFCFMRVYADATAVLSETEVTRITCDDAVNIYAEKHIY